MTFTSYDRQSLSGPYEVVLRSVLRRKIHPQYKSNLSLKRLEYDVALLKMNRPVRFSPTIIPICLPQQAGQMFSLSDSDGNCQYIF